MSGLLLLAGFTFLAGFVAVVSGFGAGTIMVPTLLLFYPVPQATLVAAILHWVISFIKLVFFWRGLDYKVLLYFGIPGVITSIVGAYVLVEHISSDWLLPYFGIFLIVYVIFIILYPTFKVIKTPERMMLSGVISGFFKGIFGVGGGIRTTVLTSFDLPKETYLSTGAAINVAIDTARLLTYWYKGVRLGATLRYSLLLLIPTALVSAYGARYVVHLIPQQYFRLVVMFFLLLAGIKFLFF